MRKGSRAGRRLGLWNSSAVLVPLLGLPRRPWLVAAGIWALSRAFFFVWGAVGEARVLPGDVVGAYPEPVGSLSYWANWDGRHYAHIAHEGYDTRPATAFFPLYPLLIRGGFEAGLGTAVAGVVVSLVASLAAMFFVYELGRAWHGERAALAATAAFAFFPTAFFLNAVYTEALFLALSAGAVWAVYVRRDLLVAGFFAYFAALTRNVGLLLVLPLAFEWWRARRTVGWTGLAGVVAPCVGFFTYVYFLWLAAGEPLLFSVVVKQYWGRVQTDPLTTARHGFEHAGDGVDFLWPPNVLETASVNPPFLLSNTIGAACLAFALVLLVLAAFRLPFGVFLYAVPTALAPLAFELVGLPLISYPRYVLAVFPLFLALGSVLARSRVALGAWLVLSAVLGAYLTVLFVTWRWVA